MTMTRPTFLRPLASGILGITLMLPGFFFILTLLARLCFGAKTPYYYFAPSFLQSPFDLFALHKAQCIIGCLLIAAACNVFVVLRFRIEKGPIGLQIAVSHRRSWLNTAVALQSTLLLLLLTIYTFIQHLRY
jgi:hypothetical protein